MEEKKIDILIKVYQLHELSNSDRELVEAARQATRNAYAPYSEFNVGAAIALANGEVVCGSNQENAAFSSGTCAERSACFYASSRFPGVAFKTIAIAASTRRGHKADASFDECFQDMPISPCGSCRQALLEYENKYGDIRVLLYGRNGVYELPSVKSLMPLSFVEF